MFEFHNQLSENTSQEATLLQWVKDCKDFQLSQELLDVLKKHGRQSKKSRNGARSGDCITPALDT